MKKSLIALAVMAASGASFAQSTVTLYGIADVWFGSLKNSATSGDPESATLLGSGGVSTSRWGLMGSEDLGGGLKAVFKFEQGVNVDTGVAGSGFDRQSYVGFSGNFGEVLVGKPWTAIDDIMGASNSGFDTKLSATNGVWITNSQYAGNPGNTIKYTSPSFSGFDFAAAYSLDEATDGDQDVVDFRVSYAGGPIAANFGYQVRGNFFGMEDGKFTTVNGSYNLGMAKLLASYGQIKAGSAKVNEYQIGLDVPVSSAMTVSAGYAYSDRNDVAEAAIPAFGEYAGSENSGFGIAVAYSMSKRTTLYGGVSSATGESSTGADVSKRQLYAIGVKHTF